MDMFRTDVRLIVLRIKLSEEKQKKCKKKLESVFRTMQNHSTTNTSEKNKLSFFKIKPVLAELKETDELNNFFKASLREILIKISELKLVDKKKTNEIPGVNEGELSSENPLRTPDIQQLHGVRFISVEKRPNTRTPEIQTRKFGNLAASDIKSTVQGEMVTFKNALTIESSKFIVKGNTIHMNIGPMQPVKNISLRRTTSFVIHKRNFARAVYTPTIFCTLFNYFEIPELKKIRCKIKR